MQKAVVWGYRNMVPVPTQAGFPLDAVRANAEESWQEFYLNERGHGSLVNQKKPLGKTAESTFNSSKNPSEITDIKSVFVLLKEEL